MQKIINSFGGKTLSPKKRGSTVFQKEKRGLKRSGLPMHSDEAIWKKHLYNDWIPWKTR